MHPLLSNRRRLGLYAIGWLPLLALLLYLLMGFGCTMRQSAALAAVLVPLYAAICLAAWFPCRATPVPQTGLAQLVSTHLAAGAVLSTIWVFIAFAYIALLQQAWGPFTRPGIYTAMFAAGMLLYSLSVALHYVLLAMENSRLAEAREREARLLARDAELRALKAQINPHFLFNSLHSISALTTIDPAKAREMCVTLADFLRNTLGLGQKELIPFSEEIALVRSFVSVEKVRFGQQVQMREVIDDGVMSCLVPPLLLQPLVENAITHGLANLAGPGEISLRASLHAGHLTVEIDNDFDPDYRPKRKSGIGLQNVRERLAARYGTGATFLARVDGTRFCVKLTLPQETEVAR